MKIKEAMNPQLKTIEPDATLKDAAQKMKEFDVGALPVREGEKLVGILTDRDIVVRATAEGLTPENAHVRDAMTPQVVCCTPDQDVKEAAHLMEEKKIRRLAVVDGQQLPVGMLSLGDVATRSKDTRLAGEVLREVSVHAGPAQRSQRFR